MEKTDNEIIAEFMGIEVVQYVTHFGTVLAIVPEEGCVDWPELRVYHPDTSWEWLMPVVERIRTIYDQEPEYIDEFEEVLSIRISETRENIYKAIVEFIEWYNTQPKQNGN